MDTSHYESASLDAPALATVVSELRAAPVAIEMALWMARVAVPVAGLRTAQELSHHPPRDRASDVFGGAHVVGGDSRHGAAIAVSRPGVRVRQARIGPPCSDSQDGNDGQ